MMGEKFWVWMKFFIHGLYSAILVCVVRWVSIIFPLDLIGICKHDILYNKKKKKAKCIILFWVWSESTVYSLVKQPCGEQILKIWILLLFFDAIIHDCWTNDFYTNTYTYINNSYLIIHPFDIRFTYSNFINVPIQNLSALFLVVISLQEEYK